MCGNIFCGEKNGDVIQDQVLQRFYMKINKKKERKKKVHTKQSNINNIKQQQFKRNFNYFINKFKVFFFIIKKLINNNNQNNNNNN